MVAIYRAFRYWYCQPCCIIQFAKWWHPLPCACLQWGWLCRLCITHRESLSLCPECFAPTVYTKTAMAETMVRPIAGRAYSTSEFFNICQQVGQLLFSTKQPAKIWDGSINGLQQNPGVYVWMVKAIDYTGKPVVQKGPLHWSVEIIIFITFIFLHPAFLSIWFYLRRTLVQGWSLGCSLGTHIFSNKRVQQQEADSVL